MVILVFAVGQLAVDQVAQCIVGVFDAVVFFEAVTAAKVAALSFGGFVGKDVVGGVEGKGFAAAGLAVAGFLNASDFVVNVVVGVATVEHNSNKGRLKVVFQTTLMLINNRIIKEPIFQTASKKVLRSSEKRKPCECVPHTHPASGLKILCKLRLATLGLKVLCGATAC